MVSRPKSMMGMANVYIVFDNRRWMKDMRRAGEVGEREEQAMEENGQSTSTREGDESSERRRRRCMGWRRASSQIEERDQ